jgi:hypothetical protein
MAKPNWPRSRPLHPCEKNRKSDNERNQEAESDRRLAVWEEGCQSRRSESGTSIWQPWSPPGNLLRLAVSPQASRQLQNAACPWDATRGSRYEPLEPVDGVSEPSARYDRSHGYTQDLGGNPVFPEALTDSAVRDPAGQESRATTNRNILAAAEVPGARFATVAGPIQTGSLRVGSVHVRYGLDAANAMLLHLRA